GRASPFGNFTLAAKPRVRCRLGGPASPPNTARAKQRQVRCSPGVGIYVGLRENEYPFLRKKCNNTLTGNFEALLKYEGSETGSLKCDLVPLNRPQRIQKSELEQQQLQRTRQQQQQKQQALSGSSSNNSHDDDDSYMEQTFE
ncbi:hypothetical protein GZH46_02968, partial [Fragariocoptes setiger]